MTRVFISPKIRESAMGGISRVIEAQKQWLPEYGVTVVETPEEADVLALHAAAWVEPTPNQRVVAHCHGLYWAEYDWNKWSYAVNSEVINNLRRADVITAPSEWVSNAIRRDTWANVITVGHGVNTADWRAEQNNNYVLWNKTRADAVCDPKSVEILAMTMPDTQFVTTFTSTEDFVLNNIKVIGALPYREHKEWIQHAGLYLCTPRETFGIGTLEAMACGVPIVGWNYGGQSEFIVSGEHGWLATPGDYDGLVRGIEYCQEHRDRLGQACRELVEEKFAWKNVIKEYATIYHRLTQQMRVESPKISVIISSYNLKRYLTKSVASVLQQNRDDTEIIIVDDCSTDGSYELATSMAESNSEQIKVVQTKTNSNMPTVLNLGIESARGQYIVPLDADNMLAPGSLETLSGELDKNRNYDIVYGRVKFTVDDGVTPDTRVSPDGISAWPPDIFSYEAQMGHKNQIPSTAMYRKSIWTKSGGYRKRCSRIGEDPDFWCRTTSLGAKPAKVTDAVTLIYRIRDDSRSNTTPEWPWEQWYPNKGFMTGGPIHISESLISVIIPVGPGHGVQGIEDALDSIYAQTFTNWECIVVDDTFDHMNNIRSEIRWLPSWVRYYKTGMVGAGVSIARNIGIKQARGKAFFLLDADDYLDKTALEKMYKAWQQNPQSYVYSGWFKTESMEAYSINTEYRPEHMLHNLLHPVSCLYPIQVRDKIEFDETMKVGEDWDYVLSCMANRFCGVYIDEPLLYYRQSSGRNRKGLQDNIEQIRSTLGDKYRERVMACGCSQKKISPQLNNEQLMASLSGNNNDSELVLVEYTGSSVGSISYTGPATGTSYRFGLSDGNNIKYVRRGDADALLQRNEFRLPELATA